MILGRIARRTTTTTTATALGAGLAAALMLSACHGQHNASPPPPTFATPTAITATTGNATNSPTSGTSPTNPGNIPAAARANTAAGAEAFARLYFTRLNEAFLQPDHSQIAALADRHCESCTMLGENIHGLASDRERVADPPFTLGPVVELPISTPRARVFSTTLIHAESRILNDRGLTVRTEPRERRGIHVLVRRTSTGWTIGDIGQAS